MKDYIINMKDNNKMIEFNRKLMNFKLNKSLYKSKLYYIERD